MSGRKLLDSNHLSAATYQVSPIRDRLRGEMRRGVAFGVCVPILCEVEIGLRQARHEVECRRELGHLLHRIRIWPLEIDLAAHYADIYGNLRDRGRVLSQVDILVAAMCRSEGLMLVSTDRDFEALPDIRTENWLA